MRPTALGIKALVFHALIVFAFYVGPYNNLFFLQLAFLSVVLVSSAPWTAASLHGVTARLGAVGPFAAGEPHSWTVQLRVAHGQRFAIELVARLGDVPSTKGARRTQTIVLGGVPVATGDTAVTLRLPALPRGVYPLQGLWLQSRYPFGLLARRVAIPHAGAVAIHAAPLAAAPGGRGPGSGEALGPDGAALALAATPSTIRDHRPGDGLRQIHWRATARRGRPIVKEFDPEGAGGIEVAVDRRHDAERFERELRQVATAALLARETKRPVRLTTQGLQAEFGPGHRPLDELLAWTAAATRLPADAPGLPAAALRRGDRQPAGAGAAR